jgi:hypothetical protein
MKRQAVAVGFSQESGKDLAKVETAESPGATVPKKKPEGASERPVAGFGKGTAKYWEQKVYRPAWREDGGQRREVSHYFVRIMVSGRRQRVWISGSAISTVPGSARPLLEPANSSASFCQKNRSSPCYIRCCR